MNFQILSGIWEPRLPGLHYREVHKLDLICWKHFCCCYWKGTFMLSLKRYFNVIRAGRMIPIVMGASKEAYSLFGPEVRYSDIGKKWCFTGTIQFNNLSFMKVLSWNMIKIKCCETKIPGFFHPCCWLQWPNCSWTLSATAQTWFGLSWKIIILFIRYILFLPDNDMIIKLWLFIGCVQQILWVGWPWISL